ncbi:MAG: serine/threonine-protein kinase, partial [Tepidiformaceae bacterium]
MPSERIQRRIEAFLDEADAAASAGDWAVVAEKARAVLAIDEANDDAQAFLKMVDGAAGGMPRGTAPAGAPAVPALPASFFSGRYRVLRLLGEGGKKRVYLARDERLQRDVAFALVRTEGVDSLGRERILREAQHMGRVGAHPNLVTVHDIGEEDGNPCIVQEFMGGGDVATLLAQGTPAVVRTLAIAADVLQGLSFMHGQGIVHRDLKPANVFLAADGTAKVGDFGLAIAGDLSRLTQHGTLVGTVAYMPPEQAVGGEVSARSDLYSLGAMLYEMITGRPPFQGDDATAVISQHLNTAPVAPSWHTEDCPPPLEALILRMLEKDPAKRPASAAEVAAALAVIDPDEKSSRHSTENPLAGLARGVFVGREKEMERLRKAFDEAFAGRGSLAMLVGEPGIGKTRTTR